MKIIRNYILQESILPFFIGLGGVVYGVTSFVFCAIFLYLAVEVWRLTEGRPAEQASKRLFWFSILYLYALFSILVLEGLATRFLQT